MVPLRNTGSEMLVATYYPSIVGRRCDDRLYSVQKVRSKAGKLMTIKQPFSFSIPPGEIVEVHEVALHLPQVKIARKRGQIQVVDAAEWKAIKARRALAKKDASAAAVESPVKPSKAKASKSESRPDEGRSSDR